MIGCRFGSGARVGRFACHYFVQIARIVCLLIVMFVRCFLLFFLLFHNHPPPNAECTVHTSLQTHTKKKKQIANVAFSERSAEFHSRIFFFVMLALRWTMASDGTQWMARTPRTDDTLALAHTVGHWRTFYLWQNMINFI